MSEVGLGCNNFGTRCDERQTLAVVNAAIDVGVNFFDTADVYGKGLSEEYLGKALGRLRDEVIVASKFGHPMSGDPGRAGSSPEWIRKAIDGTLKRLGSDYVDLYQAHVPDAGVPIEETLGALTQLVSDGKVRAIGCSNYSGEQIDSAMRASEERGLARFISAQNHYNLLVRDAERDVLPACVRHGLGQLPYFPLASGLLSGKYRMGSEPPKNSRLGAMPDDRRRQLLSDERLDLVERLIGFAASIERSLLELAIGWLLSKSVIASVIAGATSADQARANAMAAALRLRLAPDQLSELESLLV